MTPSQRLQRARNCFRLWLDQSGVVPVQDDQARESVLIADGFYVGRRFPAATHWAIWFTEEDELKIHDAAGCVVACLAAADMDFMTASPARRAA